MAFIEAHSLLYNIVRKVTHDATNINDKNGESMRRL